MTEKLPYMPFYGRDFYDDSAVKMLSMAAQGLYLALLWRQWVDGAIPTDFKVMAKLIGHDVKEVKGLWPEIAHFFERTDRGGVNAKLEKVRSALTARRAAQQRGAATANAKRPLKGSVSDTGSVLQMPANETATAIALGSTEGEREGKPKISYGQFLYFAGQAAKWRNENGHLYVGGDAESYARGFQIGVGVSLADFESWEREFGQAGEPS